MYGLKRLELILEHVTFFCKAKIISSFKPKKKNPAELLGCDVSAEMLHKLQEKYPGVKPFLLRDDALKEFENLSCDIIVSNLVIGYIKDLSKTFSEWNRILKNKGEIINTDFHPVSLQKGATRSFRYKERMIHIRNYIHTLNKIKSITTKLHWNEIHCIEKNIDESVNLFLRAKMR